MYSAIIYGILEEHYIMVVFSKCSWFVLYLYIILEDSTGDEILSLYIITGLPILFVTHRPLIKGITVTSQTLLKWCNIREYAWYLKLIPYWCFSLFPSTSLFIFFLLFLVILISYPLFFSIFFHLNCCTNFVTDHKIQVLVLYPKNCLFQVLGSLLL